MHLCEFFGISFYFRVIEDQKSSKRVICYKRLRTTGLDYPAIFMYYALSREVFSRDLHYSFLKRILMMQLQIRPASENRGIDASSMPTKIQPKSHNLWENGAKLPKKPIFVPKPWIFFPVMFYNV